jgi:hypothetical protein
MIDDAARTGLLHDAIIELGHAKARFAMLFSPKAMRDIGTAQGATATPYILAQLGHRDHWFPIRVRQVRRARLRLESAPSEANRLEYRDRVGAISRFFCMLLNAGVLQRRRSLGRSLGFGLLSRRRPRSRMLSR